MSGLRVRKGVTESRCVIEWEGESEWGECVTERERERERMILLSEWVVREREVIKSDSVSVLVSETEWVGEFIGWEWVKLEE